MSHADGDRRVGASPRDQSATQPLGMPLVRRIGSTDMRTHPVALSGATFGWTAGEAATQRILDAFASHGGTLVVTADTHASGRSETMIGSWMRSRRCRERMLVATEVGRSQQSPGLSRRAIVRSVEASLERLGVETIDLLQLHGGDASDGERHGAPAVPIEESLVAVGDLQRAGKVRWLGAVGFDHEALVGARMSAAHQGLPPFVAVRHDYSLLDRGFEGPMAFAADVQRLGVLASAPLAGGFLAGAFRSRTDIREATRIDDVGRLVTRRSLALLDVIDELAAAHGVHAGAVALAWLLTRHGLSAPVVSASAAVQIDRVMAAATVLLTRQQIHALDRASEAARR